MPLANAEFGHIPVAVVDCPPATDFATLAQWCSDKLTNYQQPRHWLALSTALQNGGIKISRHQLQQWAAQTMQSAKGK